MTTISPTTGSPATSPAPASPAPTDPGRMDHEAYVEAVLSLVEQIPIGQVSTYGDLAEMVGRGGPRGVGKVMSLYGGAVPWWRVIRASGHPPAHKEAYALGLLRAEGVALHGSIVDLRRARWHGPDPSDNLSAPVAD